jgi:hypothetical protein
MMKVPPELQIRFNLEHQRDKAVHSRVHVLHLDNREWYLTNEVLEAVPGGTRPSRVAPIVVIVDGARRRCYGHGFVDDARGLAYIRVIDTHRAIREQAVASDEVVVEVKGRPS